MDDLVYRAEGIFLWVILMVYQLEDAILNGDSMGELEQILYSALYDLSEWGRNEIVGSELYEMDIFLRYTLDPINKSYKISLWLLFAISLRLVGRLISREEEEPSRYGVMDSNVVETSGSLTLLSCRHLMDVVSSGGLESLDRVLP